MAVTAAVGRLTRAAANGVQDERLARPV